MARQVCGLSDLSLECLHSTIPASLRRVIGRVGCFLNLPSERAEKTTGFLGIKWLRPSGVITAPGRMQHQTAQQGKAQQGWADSSSPFFLLERISG